MKTSTLINSLLLPVKLIVPQPIIARIPGLTTNEDIRIHQALKRTRGRLLDIGCGNNRLAREYRDRGGDAIGVDVYDWGEQDLLVMNTADLPFEDHSFDSVTMIACINHIPNREAVLEEARRLLRPNGRLILTNLTPFISTVWHKFAFWDEDQHERGMKAGEVYGLSRRELGNILARAAFVAEEISRFSLGLNTIYVYRKEHSLIGSLT